GAVVGGLGGGGGVQKVSQRQLGYEVTGEALLLPASRGDAGDRAGFSRNTPGKYLKFAARIADVCQFVSENENRLVVSGQGLGADWTDPDFGRKRVVYHRGIGEPVIKQDS